MHTLADRVVQLLGHTAPLSREEILRSLNAAALRSERLPQVEQTHVDNALLTALKQHRIKRVPKGVMHYTVRG